ncbi:MAG TPA: ergothioneine biosynthesis glutamate--cysteine ligase EgtA [Pseudonocardia sp.]
MTPKAAQRALNGREASAAPSGRVLHSRDEAEAYVASVCFKHGPPRLIGVELEWLLARRSDPPSPLDVHTLVTALGPHTPTSLDPFSPALPLPRGSLVTVEPGGQVEIASIPFDSTESLVDAVRSDSATLLRLLADQGLHPLSSASDPVRPAHRLLTVPRYLAMEAAFDRLGAEGRGMMCSTAAVQPSLDLGERVDLPLRWSALHLLGPVLVAAFANSPLLQGRRSGWKSSRMACWLGIDPPRTAPPDPAATDPAAAYATRAMNADVICVRRPTGSWESPPGVTFADWLAGGLPGRPTTDDLDLHLSTLFPPVRPHGRHAEIRYVDAQPGEEWVVPVVVLAALLSDTATTAATVEACLPVAGRWTAGARDGLADPELARAARTVFTLALGALPRVIGPGLVQDLVQRATEERVLRGLSPADLQPTDTAAQKGIS